ncbi:unnamed protein product [Rotaria sp. Silwood1]|nr:unnamed protein product [Rotaria sp. Silwood1]CAF1419406.1 unnamed protein product [Rotaria sp. Silwood1]
MIKKIFVLTILICLTVISQENYDDIVSFLIDGTQRRTNITCLCTKDEKCDSNTETCRLTHVNHVCYESWTKDPYDNTIHVTAGCVYNEFFFTQIFCNGNQTNRYIICCSDEDYCNDRDAYSSDIRKKLLPKAVLLGPTKFANQVILEKNYIGIGAYGAVYRGKWHQDTIAVKICLSNEEPSWRREVYIYEEFRLNHENVLRYIAADNIDSSNRIELWLGTEYHENGSVYDYLQNHTITIPIMINMMFTIANGLFYLHISIEATNGKPALAHRDLKTKNILVKKDLSCCIADLGLAVSEVRPKNSDLRNNNNNKERIVIDVKPHHRVGTIRYMAPEILDKTLNEQIFESYKATDLYALGLVFWEILRRCHTTTADNDADEYKLPYQDVLPNNPTFEQMHEVVCIKKIRPESSPRWENNSTFCNIFTSCQELWTEKPECRPSSYIIKEKLRNQQNQ